MANFTCIFKILYLYLNTRWCIWCISAHTDVYVVLSGVPVKVTHVKEGTCKETPLEIFCYLNEIGWAWRSSVSVCTVMSDWSSDPIRACVSLRLLKRAIRNLRLDPFIISHIQFATVRLCVTGEYVHLHVLIDQ